MPFYWLCTPPPTLHTHTHTRLFISTSVFFCFYYHSFLFLLTSCIFSLILPSFFSFSLFLLRAFSLTLSHSPFPSPFLLLPVFPLFFSYLLLPSLSSSSPLLSSPVPILPPPANRSFHIPIPYNSLIYAPRFPSYFRILYIFFSSLSPNISPPLSHSPAGTSQFFSICSSLTHSLNTPEFSLPSLSCTTYCTLIP